MDSLSYAVDVSEEFRSAAHGMVDEVADYLAALPSKPVWQPMPDGLRSELLDMPLPEEPAALRSWSRRRRATSCRMPWGTAIRPSSAG